MQVVYSAVDYADDCFYCNYAGDSFFIAKDLDFALAAKLVF